MFSALLVASVCDGLSIRGSEFAGFCRVIASVWEQHLRLCVKLIVAISNYRVLFHA